MTINSSNHLLSKTYPGISFLCPNNFNQNLNDRCDGSGILGNLFLAEFLGTFVFVNIIISIKY